MTLSEETATENILSFSYRAVTMDRIIFLVCLCVAVEGDIGKHVFIENKETWSSAQAYCRQYHTDLSFFNSQSEIEKLPRAADGNLVPGWIGLYRDPNNKTAWKWSGGGHITFQNWADRQPDNSGGTENNAVITWNGLWTDVSGSDFYSFYCVDKDPNLPKYTSF
uniref:C-type lectin domain-containing protein n=1 Tax=Amphiprion ocellaris TaxID=80972 RepID=A0A3Q1AW29_AMPOC